MSYTEQERATKAMEIGFKVMEIMDAYKAGAMNMGRSTTFPIMAENSRSMYAMEKEPTTPHVYEVSVRPTWPWRP